MSEIRLARQSNMELLRIVAMLMVMVLHTGYASFGYPRTVWLQAEPLRWLGLTMTEVYTVACVNIFVLITGWFGTTFRTKGRCAWPYNLCTSPLCLPCMYGWPVCRCQLA